MLNESQLDNIAESARRVGQLERDLRILQRRGGKGDLQEANEQLEEAIEVFSAEAYANLTLSEIAQAGGRIQRLAVKCQAIERMDVLQGKVAKAREAHTKLLKKVRSSR